MWRVSSVLSLAGLSQPFRFSEAATTRGTAVHDAAERLAHGESFAVHQYDVWSLPNDSENHAPFVDALQKWFVDFKPEILLTERRVVSKRQRCTGRIDMGVLLDGEGVIVDLKTGGAAASHGIQVCGYQDLANADDDLQLLLNKYDFGPWNRAILYLKADGRYDWRGPMRLLQDGPQDSYLWRSALALVQWRYDHGLLSLTDPEVPEDDRPATA